MPDRRWVCRWKERFRRITEWSWVSWELAMRWGIAECCSLQTASLISPSKAPTIPSKSGKLCRFFCFYFSLYFFSLVSCSWINFRGFWICVGFWISTFHIELMCYYFWLICGLPLNYVVIVWFFEILNWWVIAGFTLQRYSWVLLQWSFMCRLTLAVMFSGLVVTPAVVVLRQVGFR